MLLSNRNGASGRRIEDGDLPPSKNVPNAEPIIAQKIIAQKMDSGEGAGQSMFLYCYCVLRFYWPVFVFFS